ncbi:hypothetical protein DPMN_043201 [Dreissena polymorpha]|uniref:Beta-lactamase-related domain-containing protein n=1 Tax=Dreissena polymorpha TaxID=45954 RepID=A0A9D4HXL4_DREPO|nr:hypothetical protein DPMN_043201 [Dreissena polymorpha]
MMYVVLGHLTEMLGKRSWEKLMMSKLFKPIGMTSSFILEDSDEVFENGFAKPYILRNGQLELGTEGIYRYFNLFTKRHNFALSQIQRIAVDNKISIQMKWSSS